jgi:hypothetical protein
VANTFFIICNSQKSFLTDYSNPSVFGIENATNFYIHGPAWKLGASSYLASSNTFLLNSPGEFNKNVLLLAR